MSLDDPQAHASNADNEMMELNKLAKGDQSNRKEDDPLSIHSYCKTHTAAANFLKIEKPHFKLYRPNMYDIGGSYIEGVLDFWFMMQTEVIGKIMLLHVYVNNYQEHNFTVSLSSCTQDISIDNRKQTVHLTPSLNDYTFYGLKKCTTSYITTYSFEDLDVQAFKSKTLYIPIKIYNDNKAVIFKSTAEATKLNHDFSAFFDNEQESDFVIESDEGKCLPAHKIVLASHSRVFEAMFKEENQDLMIKNDRLVESCSTEDLKNFLEFIYTGTIRNLDDCNAHVMLLLADKYEVHGLREMAEMFLCQDINIGNYIETLNSADLYNSEKVKFASFKFIKQNASKINFKELGKEFVNKDLVFELVDYVTNNAI